MKRQQFGWCVAVVAIAVMVLSAGRVTAQTDTGVDVPSGNWTTPGDWSDGVPTSADDAFIGSGSVGFNVATCTLNSAGQECDRLYIGHLVGSSGQLDFTGGSLKVYGGTNPDAAIGERGSGVVNHSAGTWDNGGGTFSIGNDSSGDGEYNLSGGGVVSNISTLYVGYEGSGTLNITNNGILQDITTGTISGYNGGGSGVVSVAGGTWDNGGRSITLGRSLNSYGRLNISGGLVTNIYRLYLGDNGHGTVSLSGGTFQVIRPTDDSDTYIGYGSGGTGVVYQTGGVWDSGNGHLSIGQTAGGYGEYNISGGVITNVNALAIPQNGMGLLSIVGSTPKIYAVEFRGQYGNGTLRVTPDAMGIGTISISGSGKTRLYGARLEVDLSNYESTNDLTIITYIGDLDEGASGPGFATTNILPITRSAEVSYATPGEVRLINITGPPGTLITVR